MLKEKGFTLIELLVVVLIIGILAAIALPQYQLAVLKTRYTQLMIMADAIRQAQDAYYLATGKYSLKINDLDITVPGDCTLSDNGAKIYCPKFACVVYDGSEYSEVYGSVYCYLDSNGSRLRYLLYRLKDKKERRCVTFVGDSLGKKVCESLGAKYYNSYNTVDYYIF